MPACCARCSASEHRSDLVIDRGGVLTAVEIKAGRTAPSDAFDGLDAFARLAPSQAIHDRVVIYGGETTERRSAGHLLAWTDIASHDWNQ